MKNSFLYTVLLYLAFTSCQTKRDVFITAENAVVQTAYGKVRGYQHNLIYTYKGIPYAEAKRFMPPRKPQSWAGIRNSMTYGPVSPQAGPSIIDESEFFFQHNFGFQREDCLRLNIWSPSVNQDKKRPVMVWLHGGGFATGSGNELAAYDGESLSKTGDVVVISLNHRLNALGFLNLSSFGEKYKYSGNVGMLDILEALNWVKQNVSAFGGDPNNITIFGQSGGGRKVCALLAAPRAKGLFHKSIVQSGTALQFYTKAQSQRIGELVVQELGLKASQVDSLQRMPYSILLAAGERVLSRLGKHNTQPENTIDRLRYRWGPMVGDDVLPYQPGDEQTQLMMNNVPLMIGTTKNEFVTAFDSTRFINPQTMDEARRILSLKYKDKTDQIIGAIQKSYPQAKKPIDVLDIEINGRVATIELANIKAKNNVVYNYLFEWESPVLEGRFRSCHCLELPFVFNNIAKCKEMTGGQQDAYQLASKMSKAWIAFARTGNPNNKDLPAWESYNQQNGATMLFNNTNRLLHHHDKELLQSAGLSKAR